MLAHLPSKFCAYAKHKHLRILVERHTCIMIFQGRPLVLKNFTDLHDSTNPLQKSCVQNQPETVST
jgi:hypothetical protein